MTDASSVHLDAEALIELYFELEDDDERDIVLGKLEAIDTPLVTEFWRTAAAEDDDELVRARALANLARRGDAEAKDALHALVDGPDDTVVFEEALRSLALLGGQPYYATLEALWRDETRSADERRIAMTVMESVDPARALEAFAAFIDGLGDAATFPDDQVEVVMLAFVRHERDERARLHGLLKRLTASSVGMDIEERDELLGMIREGIDLLG